MRRLDFNYSNALDFVHQHELDYLADQVKLAHEKLHLKQGPGSDFLGWVDWPKNYDQQEYQRLKQAAKRIQDSSDVLLVIGIGGSYLGARAAIDLLTHSFYNVLSCAQRRTPQIFYVGHQISGSYIHELLEVIEGKDISINVISKSGTTTEPALAFRIFRSYLEDKYGAEEAAKRIYATTDQAKGALKRLADEKGYESFVIPDNIGGRYSVLTPVGLLPISVAGIDTDAMLAGAQAAMEWYSTPNVADNASYQYAALRNLLYCKGKTTEILVNYEPKFQYFAEWWKQLFGESEGKDQKGIFPASVNFSTDLHSLGQYIQEGLRNIFETVLVVDKPDKDVKIDPEPDNLDGLNYLAGQSLDFVNKKAYQGTLLAHVDGGVPNLVLTIPEISAFYFGALVYFFEKACGISGYLLGVNPFDQPGVEAYKENMFSLLGKPGFEEKRKILEARLEK
ncbi:MAG: glucose-6-phosphate isomerase [Firmicutes bacterium]|nr:glucose-6-phosphate isomerase [Bacillota bacterium]